MALIEQIGNKQSCVCCGVPTLFLDTSVNLRICSDVCKTKLMAQHQIDAVQQVMARHIAQFRTEIQAELVCAYQYQRATKDIIIIVHDQLEYLKQCIQSIEETTEDYQIYIWDNNSKTDMKDYIKELMYRNKAVSSLSVEKNEGFIRPNNILAKMGNSDYIILLNSDTRVLPEWDKALIGFMQHNPDVKLTGYMGCKLDEKGFGGRADLGYNIDYVCGWCACFPRSLYNQIGLFDENLKFAYCEDSDFSLRVQQAGYKIYSSHLMLVHHYENKTIKVVQQEGEVDVRATFDYNHEYLRNKWADYLAHHRVDLRLPQEPDHEQELV